MKLRALLAPLILVGCAPLYVRSTTIQFRSDSALTVKSGTWHALEAADAPSPPQVWMQEGTGEAAQFNLCLSEPNPPLNADVRVKLRAVHGVLDQGGGIAWRARDEQDY